MTHATSDAGSGAVTDEDTQTDADAEVDDEVDETADSSLEQTESLDQADESLAGARPPSQATCDAMPPKKGCHYALIPSSYCGGAPPPPEMLWPSCVCSVCSRDAHCGKGQRCVTLPTDAECHPRVAVCVNPKRRCTSNADCSSGEWCMADGNRSTCGKPTMYPARP